MKFQEEVSENHEDVHDIENGIEKQSLEALPPSEEAIIPQPDVVSGLENLSDNISQHLDQEIPNSSTAEKDSSDNSDTKSSEFESIYDKYRDKSDEEVEDPPTDPVSFQPAEVSNDELNEMLDDLEDGASAMPTNELGARPKEFVTQNEVPDLGKFR